MSARAGAAGPRPGSIHFFAELYAPAAVRAALRQAHMLEAEVRASLRVGLDHGVAHARLDWWQQEAGRARAGNPSHPLLPSLVQRGGAAATGAALADWVQAARIELAGGLGDPGARAEHGRRSMGAGFALIAALLEADIAAARELGTSLAGLRGAPDTAAVCGTVLDRVGAIGPHAQPALRPLLVWTALALRRARRGAVTAADATGPAGLALFGDNFHAWRAARAADAGRIHYLLEVPRA